MAEQKAIVVEDDGRTMMNLFKPDGSFKAQVSLPTENLKGVKVLKMPDGATYNRVNESDWQQEGGAEAE